MQKYATIIVMLNFIVNPKSGKGKGRRNMKKIIKYLTQQGETFKVVYSERAKEIPELVKNLCDEGADNVIAVGGDGTINEALNGIVDFDKTTFGIIPSGNGNDFATFFGLPLNPIKALEHVTKNAPVHTDFIEIGDENKKIRCMNVAGTGIDAEVLARCARFKVIKGKLQYIIALLQTIRRFEFFKFRSMTNGAETVHSGFIAAVCNGNQFGGGIKISPESDPHDGKLNLIIINELPRNKIMWALRKKLLKDKVLEVPETEQHFVDEVEIIPEKKPFFLNVDGELYNDVAFKCKLIHKKLRIFK